MEKLAVEIKKKLTKKVIGGVIILGIMLFVFAGIMAWKCLTPSLKNAENIEVLG